jgi:hypothetical protein
MAQIWGRGWGGTFIVWEIPVVATVPTFGPPFLDLRSAIRATLGVTSPVIQAVGVRSTVRDSLEMQNLLPSSRIDRSHL